MSDKTNVAIFAIMAYCDRLQFAALCQSCLHRSFPFRVNSARAGWRRFRGFDQTDAEIGGRNEPARWSGRLDPRIEPCLATAREVDRTRGRPARVGDPGR